MKNYYEKLEENPLFQMSLGSKELFHSNFLYWLYIKYPNYFGEIFQKLSGNEELGTFKNKIKNGEKERNACSRETKNIDLTIEYENDIIYVENKVKSNASQNQLKDYKDKLNGKNKKPGVFLFLGLNQPTFFKENNEYEGWKYISYDDLKKQIKKRIPNNILYRNDYINFIEALININKSFKVKLDEKFDYYNNSEKDKCQELRIHDLYLKIMYTGIGEHIKDELKDNIEWDYQYGSLHISENFGNTSFLSCSFNNGKGTLTLSKNMSIKNKEKWIMGIQLEGDQYRQFLTYIKKDIDPKKVIKVAENIKDRWFKFEEIIKNNDLIVKGNGKGTGFNQYYTKRRDHQELFLYKYVKLSELTNVSVRNVIKYFKDNLDYLITNSDIIKNILYSK